MNVEFNLKGGKMRAYLIGEIDHHSAKKMCKALDFRICADKPKILLLDFSRVTFMDSSGLAVAVGRKKLCDKYGIKAYITNISGNPEKILRMAGTDRLIEFLEDDNEE